jgi:hypothetical protein
MAGEKGTGTITGPLTDGTGISRLTGSKVVKDFALDFVLGAAAGIGAANIASVEGAIAAPAVAIFATLNALIKTVFRFVVRWASSD